MERLEARITGRVQGVGFRAYARREARRLGLNGWVRNEPDGAVRVVAEGSAGALDDLAAVLHRGPGTARVTNVEEMRMAAEGTFDGFDVRYS